MLNHSFARQTHNTVYQERVFAAHSVKCVDAHFNSFLTEALLTHLELIELNRKNTKSNLRFS